MKKKLLSLLLIICCQLLFSQSRTVSTLGGTPGKYVLFTGNSTVSNALLTDSSGIITAGSAKFLSRRFQFVNGTQGAGKILTSDASGNATWAAIPSGVDSTHLWSIFGNSGTDSSINFIGTIDNKQLVFRVNNTFSGVLDPLNFNTCFGLQTARNSITGTQNSFLGFAAGDQLTSGSYNVGVGSNALTQNMSGLANTAIGYAALFGNSSGVNNTSVGFVSMFNNITGNGNTVVGDSAGNINITGSNNTYLGFKADASLNNLINATAIGANAVAGASNSLILGNSANVGIGTTMPTKKLQVVGSVGINDGTAATGYVFTSSDASGNGTWQPLAALPSQANKAGRLLQTNGSSASWIYKTAIDSIAGHAITLGGNFTTSGAFNTTLTSTATTNVTLPTTGTLATLAGSESLTNKKLGSLTTNGFVKTSGGDGTLSVDATTYLSGSGTQYFIPSYTGTNTFGNSDIKDSTNLVLIGSKPSKIKYDLELFKTQNSWTQFVISNRDTANSSSGSRVILQDVDYAEGNSHYGFMSFFGRKNTLADTSWKDRFVVGAGGNVRNGLLLFCDAAANIQMTTRRATGSLSNYFNYPSLVVTKGQGTLLNDDGYGRVLINTRIDTGNFQFQVHGQMFNDSAIVAGLPVRAVSGQVLSAVTSRNNVGPDVQIQNLSSGTAAASSLRILNDNNQQFLMTMFGSGNTGTGALTANTGVLRAVTGGINFVCDAGSQNMGFYSGGTDAASLVATINSSGLGIGAATSASSGLPLEIYQSLNGSVAARIINDNSGTGAYARIIVSNGTSSASLYQLGSSFTSSGINRQNGTRLDGGGVGGLTLGSSNASGIVYFNSGGANERMRIDASGNVGIGTTTTSELLTVAGNILIPTAGKTIKIKAGTNACTGHGTLVGGTLTVSTTCATANTYDVIVSDAGNAGGIVNIGSLAVTASTNGTSFVVTSSNVLDVSVFRWIIIPEN